MTRFDDQNEGRISHFFISHNDSGVFTETLKFFEAVSVETKFIACTKNRLKIEKIKNPYQQKNLTWKKHIVNLYFELRKQHSEYLTNNRLFDKGEYPQTCE